MGYYIDLEKISMDEYKEILKTSDLIPSWKIMLENIDVNFELLKEENIKNLDELLLIFKKKENIIEIASKTGIPKKYIEVLNRSVKGYRQKANKIKDFPEISEETIANLADIKIKDTLKLYDDILTAEARNKLAETTGISIDEILYLARLTDLSRIRWVNHTFAYVLLETGYDSCERVANADAQEMYDRIKKLNEERQIYNAHIGLRDMRMCIDSAKTLECEVEY